MILTANFSRPASAWWGIGKKKTSQQSLQIDHIYHGVLDEMSKERRDLDNDIAFDVCDVVMMMTKMMFDNESCFVVSRYSDLYFALC